MAAALLAVLAAAPGAVAAGWSSPFPFTTPGTLDLIDAQAAFAPRGAAAVAYGIQDVDNPGSSQAYLAIRSGSGALGGPWPIRSAREVLSLAYGAGGLELLTGAGSGGRTCCDRAQVVRVTASGALGRPRTLVGGLTGTTAGRLLTLAGGRLLAAVATERGVWVAQSRRVDRFRAAHRLTAPRQMPESMDAAWLGGQSTIVVWTQASGRPDAADPRTIEYALGSRSGPPRHVQTLITVPTGHRIDQLTVARRGPLATVAWLESWFGRGGTYHSLVRYADLGGRPSARTVSGFFTAASDPALASDPAGDQVVSWEACRAGGTCSVQVATRPARAAGFRRPVDLGAIDPWQSASPAVGAGGRAIVAWTLGGQPWAAVGSVSSGRFAAPTPLSDTAYAYDPTVTFGPGRAALAVWSQGTLNPSVWGTIYTAP